MTGRPKGRPKKPTQLKVLEGKGNQKEVKKEVKPRPKLTDCPEWIHPYAKAEWNRIAPILYKLGLLTEADLTTLTGYCQAYANWRESEEVIMQNGVVFKTPSGYQQQVPQVAIAQKYLALMSTYLSKFGLSPSDRAGLCVDSTEKDSKLSSLLAR